MYAYIAWSWKTALIMLITWIFFYEDDIQLQMQVPPPARIFENVFILPKVSFVFHLYL